MLPGCLSRNWLPVAFRDSTSKNDK